MVGHMSSRWIKWFCSHIQDCRWDAVVCTVCPEVGRVCEKHGVQILRKDKKQSPEQGWGSRRVEGSLFWRHSSPIWPISVDPVPACWWSWSISFPQVLHLQSSSGDKGFHCLLLLVSVISGGWWLDRYYYEMSRWYELMSPSLWISTWDLPQL